MKSQSVQEKAKQEDSERMNVERNDKIPEEDKIKGELTEELLSSILFKLPQHYRFIRFSGGRIKLRNQLSYIPLGLERYLQRLKKARIGFHKRNVTSICWIM